MYIQIQMTRKNSNDALKFKKRAKKFKYELGLELKLMEIINNYVESNILSNFNLQLKLVDIL